MSNAIEKKISSVIDNFGQAGKVRAIIQSDHDFEMKSHQTSANIRLLLNLGAKGSIASYFPACDETIDSPFTDKNALEIKSLKDFCNENAYIFDTGLLEALTQTPPVNNLTL